MSGVTAGAPLAGVKVVELARILAGPWAGQLLAELERLGVPAGPINTVAQALADPQIAARGMIVETARAGAAAVPGLRAPIRFSDATLGLGRASPLGEEPGR